MLEGKRKLVEVVEKYPNGHLKRRYTYYVDRDGRKILQGQMCQWPLPGGPIGISKCYDYERGRLVVGPYTVIGAP